MASLPLFLDVAKRGPLEVLIVADECQRVLICRKITILGRLQISLFKAVGAVVVQEYVMEIWFEPETYNRSEELLSCFIVLIKVQIICSHVFDDVGDCVDWYLDQRLFWIVDQVDLSSVYSNRRLGDYD